MDGCHGWEGTCKYFSASQCSLMHQMVAFITSIILFYLSRNCNHRNHRDIFQTCPRLGSSTRPEDMTLAETGFTFVSKCIAALEDRGDIIVTFSQVNRASRSFNIINFLSFNNHQ